MIATTQPSETIWRYSPQEFPFAQVVGRMLGCDDLSRLGEDSEYQRFLKRRDDQQTKYHKRFYEKVPNVLALYGAFLKEEIWPRYNEAIYYQTVPTFRVHLPGNVAVAEEHRDGDYGHQEGEVNYWLPLTDAWGANTIWIEDVPVAVKYGSVLEFDGVHRRHGNRPNDTGKTRVSIDFRVIPVSKFKASGEKSVAARRSFTVGDYFEGPLG